MPTATRSSRARVSPVRTSPRCSNRGSATFPPGHPTGWAGLGTCQRTRRTHGRLDHAPAQPAARTDDPTDATPFLPSTERAMGGRGARPLQIFDRSPHRMTRGLTVCTVFARSRHAQRGRFAP
jgi:hypothetical protein